MHWVQIYPAGNGPIENVRTGATPVLREALQYIVL